MNFFAILRAETKLVFTDAAIVLTIIGGVIFYSFLYPQPYAKESVSALHVSVVDLDKSDISRNIIYKLNATAQVDVVRRDMSQKDALKALEETKVRAVVIIPRDFKKKLALGMSPTVAVGADSSYFLIYGAVLEGAMRSVITESSKIKVANLLKDNIPVSGAKRAFTPYSLNTINLFNKDNSYTQYVVPAVFILILQQTLLIGLGILGGGVNERTKEPKYEHYKKAKIYQIFLSRFIIFGTIFFIHTLFYFGFSYEFFHITHIANIYNLLSFSTIFILAVISFGIFLGSLFSSREIATAIILFSSLPLVFSAGFVWPLEAMPKYIQYLSLISPSTPAIDGFLKLNQMGADFDMVIGDYLILVLHIIIYIALAYYVVSKKQNQTPPQL